MLAPESQALFVSRVLAPPPSFIELLVRVHRSQERTRAQQHVVLVELSQVIVLEGQVADHGTSASSRATMAGARLSRGTTHLRSGNWHVPRVMRSAKGSPQWSSSPATRMRQDGGAGSCSLAHHLRPAG